MTYSVSQRYAQALFDLSREAGKPGLPVRQARLPDGQIETVRRDLQTIGQLIGASADFASFLSSPVIPSRRRREILEHMFKGNLDALTHRFLFFLESKNRLSLIEDICVVFERLYREFKGIVKVNIVSSISLDEHQVQSISSHLKSKFNKEIEPSLQVEPAMLGGVKIQKGDTVHDYSFQAQLEQFRKQVIAA